MKNDIHGHFGLSYANYLVLPRTLLQSMPEQWQTKFVTLLEELGTAYAHIETADSYNVQAGHYKTLDDLNDEARKSAGFTANFDSLPDDVDDETWEEANDNPVYWDKDGNEVDPETRVFFPSEDPIPHYQRGRQYIEPRLEGTRYNDTTSETHLVLPT